MMNIEHRKALFTLFLGWSGLTILLSTFFLTLIGQIDFTIDYSITFPFWVDVIISFLLMYINMLAMQSFCVAINFFKPLIYSLVSIFIGILIPVEQALIVTTVFPCIYFLLVNIKHWKKVFINILVFSSLTILFQYILGIVKYQVFDLQYTQLNTFSYLILSVDLFLFYIFLMKGVKPFYEKKSIGLVVAWMFRSFSKTNSIRQDCQEASSLTENQLRFKRLLQMSYFSIQLIIILCISRLNNLLGETIVLLVMFILGRFILGNAWHSNRLSICFGFSTFVFYALAKATIPFNVSLFFTVAVAGVFVYAMYELGNKMDRLEELEQKYNDDFTKYGLSAEMARFAHDWKINKMRDKELMNKYEISSINTLNSRKRRINTAMNTN